MSDLLEELFFQLEGPAAVGPGWGRQVTDVGTLQHHLHTRQSVDQQETVHSSVLSAWLAALSNATICTCLESATAAWLLTVLTGPYTPRGEHAKPSCIMLQAGPVPTGQKGCSSILVQLRRQGISMLGAGVRGREDTAYIKYDETQLWCTCLPQSSPGLHYLTVWHDDNGGLNLRTLAHQHQCWCCGEYHMCIILLLQFSCQCRCSSAMQWWCDEEGEGQG